MSCIGDGVRQVQSAICCCFSLVFILVVGGPVLIGVGGGFASRAAADPRHQAIVKYTNAAAAWDGGGLVQWQSAFHNASLSVTVSPPSTVRRTRILDHAA